MAVITRITDFIPNTLIESQEVDDEFNQLVNLLSGVSTNKDTLLKYNNATDPVLRVDQLGAGVIQSWLQNGSEKAAISNAGLLTAAGAALTSATDPALNVNQTGAGNIQRWQGGGVTRATLSALGKLLLPAGVGATPSTDQIGNLGTYFVDAATHQTGANTTETDFSTKTVAANVFAADGDFAIFFIKDNDANNNNTKRHRLYFAGQVLFDSSPLAIAGAHFLFGFMIRKSSTVLASIGFHSYFNNIAVAFQSAPSIGGATGLDFTASNTLKTTGQNGTATAADTKQEEFVLIKGSV